jgi:hypothetical protein
VPGKYISLKSDFMKLIILLLFSTVFLISADVFAQHEHHQTQSKDSSNQQDRSRGKATEKTKGKSKEKLIQTTKDKSKASSFEKHNENSKSKIGQKKTGNEHTDHAGMQHDQMGDMNVMNHSFSRNLPMNRNGSGTAWLPDEAPMYGYMYHSQKWMYMLHGNLFLRYNNQDIGKAGSRGGDAFDAPNWVMGMAQRPVGARGLLRVSAMISLDPLTVGLNGYPLLFQSGESYKDQPLVDRQHPHDLFTELSVGYTHMINRQMDVFGYFGFPGEPALGGTAFMHRPSSLYNPDAPLGHHWQDATHITFGVFTGGFRYKNWKVEGSLFTGREPDEKRFGFDKPRFDSWSARISYNPTKSIALQLSQAFINSPELLHPDEDVKRTTASVIYAKRLNKNKMINSAVVWGFNNNGDGHKEHSVLLESAFNFSANTVYGKYEFVEKSSGELRLDEIRYGQHTKFPVNAVTLGYNRHLFDINKTNFSIGTQATVYLSSSALHTLYGNAPWAYQVFVRINPALMGGM